MLTSSSIITIPSGSLSVCVSDEEEDEVEERMGVWRRMMPLFSSADSLITLPSSSSSSFHPPPSRCIPVVRLSGESISLSPLTNRTTVFSPPIPHPFFCSFRSVSSASVREDNGGREKEEAEDEVEVEREGDDEMEIDEELSVKHEAE